VSLVADSYDYYGFVRAMIAEQELVKRCNVQLVIRPDSVTKEHGTPEDLVLWTLNELAKAGTKETSTGHKLTCYKVLWGDGIDAEGVTRIVIKAVANGFAAQNLVFGMGGGLLQKVNRDTMRFAIKCSAQMRDGQWIDVQKNPLDASKKSKAGRLALHRHPNGDLETINEKMSNSNHNVLTKVFENGIITRSYLWNEIEGR
jgi:nicotinamide phosphoribosyltransferase